VLPGAAQECVGVVGGGTVRRMGCRTRTSGRGLSPVVMTPAEYRRLGYLLRRERQKGALAFDRLLDLAEQDVDGTEPGQDRESVGCERAVSDRGVGHLRGPLQDGSSR